MDAVYNVEIKDGADVRMVQRRSEPGFPFEAFAIGFFGN
jgi:hypothetical protein